MLLMHCKSKVSCVTGASKGRMAERDDRVDTMCSAEGQGRGRGIAGLHSPLFCLGSGDWISKLFQRFIAVCERGGLRLGVNSGELGCDKTDRPLQTSLLSLACRGLSSLTIIK